MFIRCRAIDGEYNIFEDPFEFVIQKNILYLVCYKSRGATIRATAHCTWHLLMECRQISDHYTYLKPVYLDHCAQPSSEQAESFPESHEHLAGI
jgi:hypothetical protein